MATVTAHFGISQEEWNNMSENEKKHKYHQYQYEKQFGTTPVHLNYLVRMGVISNITAPYIKPTNTPMSQYTKISPQYKNTLKIIREMKNNENKNGHKNEKAQEKQTPSHVPVPSSVPSAQTPSAATPLSTKSQKMTIEDEDEQKEIIEQSTTKNESALNATPTQHSTHLTLKPPSEQSHSPQYVVEATKMDFNQYVQEVVLGNKNYDSDKDVNIIHTGTGIKAKDKTPSIKDNEKTPDVSHQPSLHPNTPLREVPLSEFLEKSDDDSDESGSDTAVTPAKRRKTSQFGSIVTRSKGIFDKNKNSRKIPRLTKVPGAEKEDKNTGNRNENTGEKGQEEHKNTNQNSSNDHNTNEENNNGRNDENGNINNNSGGGQGPPPGGDGGHGGDDNGDDPNKDDDNKKNNNQNNHTPDDQKEETDDENENENINQPGHQPQNVSENNDFVPDLSEYHEDDKEVSSSISPNFPDARDDPDGANKKMHKLWLQANKHRRDKTNLEKERTAQTRSTIITPAPGQSIQPQNNTDVVSRLSSVMETSITKITAVLAENAKIKEQSYDNRLQYDQIKREKSKNLDNTIDLFLNNTKKYNGTDYNDTGRFLFEVIKFANKFEGIDTNKSTYKLFENTVTSLFTGLAKLEWQKVKPEEYTKLQHFIHWYGTTFKVSECFRNWHNKLKTWRPTIQKTTTWDSMLLDFRELMNQYWVLFEFATKVDQSKYGYRPNQMGVLCYDGIRRCGNNKRKNVITDFVIKNDKDIQDLNLDQFENMVIKPLRKREILHETLNRGTKTKSTKPNLNYGTQVGAMQTDYTPRGGRGRGNKSGYYGKGRGRQHSQSSYSRGNYYNDRNQRKGNPKYGGKGKWEIKYGSLPKET